MNVTYDYYRIFYYVAKYQSFTRAAQILNSNQPNITRSINNLESQLGCRLFIRSNRGVSLTPEGKKLFNHVSIAFNHLKNAELELAEDEGLKRGIVTIAASETALHGLLLSVLKKFHQDYPGIRLKISNHTTPQAVEAVKQGLADFAFVTTPVELTKPLKVTKLKEFSELLICSSAYDFLAKDKQHLQEIQKYPLICLSQSSMTYKFYSDFYKKYNLLLEADIEVATVDQVIPMIDSDLGLGFVPQHIAEKFLSSSTLSIINLYEDIPKRAICIIEDTSHPLSIAANKLKETALELSKDSF